jgi:hypothetical protein
MRNNFIFSLAILGVMLPQSLAFADGYSTRVPEVPLMPGMTEIDVPGLRPGETAAVITGNDRMVITYYFQHLQDEGWEPIDPEHTQYKRGEQMLGIGAAWEKGKTTVRFKVWPPSTAAAQPATPTPEEILDGTNISPTEGQ